MCDQCGQECVSFRALAQHKKTHNEKVDIVIQVQME